MSALVFVDTNVFLYARQSNEPMKQPLAQQWLERLWLERTGRTSIQVLSEYYWNATRKVRPVLSSEEAWARVRRLLQWNPQPVDAQLLQKGRDIQDRYGLSWWDSLVVAAAEAQNCAILLSEDLQDRAIYADVTVCNPFTCAVSETSAPHAAATSPRPYRGRGRPRRSKAVLGS